MGIDVPALIAAPREALGLHWPLLAAGWGIDPRSATLCDLGEVTLFLPPRLAPIDFERPPEGFREADFLPSSEAFLALTMCRRASTWLLGASDRVGASWSARFEGGALVAADCTSSTEGRRTWTAAGLELLPDWQGDPLTAADGGAAEIPGAPDTLEALLDRLPALPPRRTGPPPTKKPKGFQRTCPGCQRRVDAARKRCPDCGASIGRRRFS